MSGRIVGLTLNAHMPDRIEYRRDDGHADKAVTVLGTTAKFVLVAMAAACQDDGSNACLSVTTIQNQTGFSKPTVITSMRCLQSIGLIEPSGKHPVYRTVIYTINLEKLAALSAPDLDNEADRAENSGTEGKAALPMSGENNQDDGKAALPTPVEIGKAALPISSDNREIGKVEGKAALPYQLTINTIQEEEEEEESSTIGAEISGTAVVNVVPNADVVLNANVVLNAGPNVRPEIYTVYEQNIGVITPFIAEALTDAVKTHSLAWVSAAIREAVEAGARNWRYINAILQRWQTQGYGTDSRRKNQPPIRSSQMPGKAPGAKSIDTRIRTDADFQRAADAFLNGGS